MADETLREFATTLRHASAAVEREAYGIIKKGAVNIKNQMRDEASGHRHFPKLAPSIRFDIVDNLGRAGIVAEIGPGTGVLAGIAYFGGSKPGGATVPDPRGALDAEAPTVERLLGDLAIRSLR